MNQTRTKPGLKRDRTRTKVGLGLRQDQTWYGLKKEFTDEKMCINQMPFDANIHEQLARLLVQYKIPILLATSVHFPFSH